MAFNRFHNLPSSGPEPPPPDGWTWTALVREALLEAENAFKAGEVPVGAIVLTKTGTIVSRAYNLTQQNACFHAEILAIQGACEYLKQKHLTNCIMVVTLEPCLMCAGAISLARISGVVFGAWDAVAGAIASRCDYVNLPLPYQKVWFWGGIHATPCVEILQKFFSKLRS